MRPGAVTVDAPDLWYNRPVTSELRSGGLVRLRVCSGGSLAWAVPAWATLCGAAASGALTLTVLSGVQLVLVWALVEAGWGTVWGAVATTDWAAPLRRWRGWHVGDDLPWLPYVRPDSPGGRVLRWLSELRGWAQAELAPAAGPAVGAVLGGLAFSLVLAAVAGPHLVLLTLAVLALMQLAVLLERGRGQPRPVWDPALRLALPWLAGHLAFAPLSLPSLALACFFGLAVSGLTCGGRVLGRSLWAMGQIAAAVLYVVLQRPLAVPFLVLLVVPQWLLASRVAEDSLVERQSWSRHAWPWLAAAMLLAAVAL
jgi:hypothetical protein